MKISKQAVELICHYELFSSKVYLCPAGIPTIGYGTTIYPTGKKVQMGDPNITEHVGKTYLYHDVSHSEKMVDVFVMTDLKQCQFDALVSFVYNIGSQNFKTSTILKLINKNPNDPLIKQQFLRWNRVKGKILPGLTKRRQSESELYFSC